MCDHHPDQVWERVTTGCQTSSDPCLAATTQGGTGTEVTVQVSLQRLNRVVMDKKTRPCYKMTASVLLKVRSKRQAGEADGKTEGDQNQNFE